MNNKQQSKGGTAVPYIAHLCRSMLALGQNRQVKILHWGFVILFACCSYAHASTLGQLNDHLHNEARWLFPFVVVSLLWALETLIGILIAWHKHDISPEKFNRCFEKIIFWIVVFFACGILRWAGEFYSIMGFDWFQLLAGGLEAAAIGSQFAGLLRNLGEWSPKTFPGFASTLNRFADRAESTQLQLKDVRAKLSSIEEKVAQAPTLGGTMEFQSKEPMVMELKPAHGGEE